MTLPLWAWNREKEKYEVIPTRFLKQYPDGQWGLEWPVMLAYNNPKELTDWFRDYFHCFTLDETNEDYPRRYLIKKRGE